RGLHDWAEGVPLLTDDRPCLEFAAGREVRDNVSRMPELYRSHVESVASRAEPVAGYLAATTPADQDVARNATLIRDSFLKARAAAAGDDRAGAEAYESAMARLTAPSPLLSSRYQALILESGRASYAAHQWEDAIAMYRRGLDHDPGFHQAAFDLALIHAREGHYDLARQFLDRIADVDSLRDRVAGFRHVLDAEERQASAHGSPGR
ncbi:MAG TPA: tetratricopeptide repeat protein, partial [Candidatus Udaeobacter sp.]|nr:tetratricopeptide repeat protein [Candidatus Udaeobacter sp.]